MILTVGHSTRSLDEFVSILRAHRVQTLLDVRRYPGSRRYPHFGAAVLEEALATAGIDYVHVDALGGRRTPRPDSRNTALRNPQFRGYADHMETKEFRAALDGLVARAAREVVVIMCAEALPWRCHRSLIADALVARGAGVEHIMSSAERTPHELSKDAVFIESAVWYPSRGDPSLPLE